MSLLRENRPSTRRVTVLLLLVIALAFVLRGRQLSSESAWCDEALTLSVLGAPSLPQYLKDAFRTDPMARMVPVYPVTQYAWSRVFGPSDETLRWLSILLGVSCLPLLFWLTRRLFDTATALLAVFLLALSQVHIYQSQEVRFYALLLALSLLSMTGLQRGLDTHRKRWWCLHGVANGLMMWTHAFAPLFFCAQGVYLLLNGWRAGRRIIVWVAFHLFIALAFTLWLYWLGFAVGRESHAYHLMPITWRNLANTFIVFAGGRPTRENPAPYMPGGISLDIVLALLFALALVTLVLSPLRHREAALEKRRGGLLCFLWAFLPFILLYLISRVWANVFFYRYVIYCLPPASTLFAAGLLGLPGKPFRRGAITLVLLALLYQAVFIPRPFRADYRSVGRMIAGDTTAKTRVLALKEFNGIAVRYNTPVPGDQIETYHGFRELCTATIGHLQEPVHLWVVFYWWDDIDVFEKRIRESVPSVRVKRHTFAGMPPPTVFELWIPKQGE